MVRTAHLWAERAERHLALIVNIGQEFAHSALEHRRYVTDDILVKRVIHFHAVARKGKAERFFDKKAHNGRTYWAFDKELVPVPIGHIEVVLLAPIKQRPDRLLHGVVKVVQVGMDSTEAVDEFWKDDAACAIREQEPLCIKRQAAARDAANRYVMPARCP